MAYSKASTVRSLVYASALAGCLSVSSAWAQAPASGSAMPGSAAPAASGDARFSSPPVDSARPTVQQTNGVSYITGGFGLDESEALKAAIPEYSVAMVFSEASGAYVADVPVNIKGTGGGASLDVTARGPYLLMNLPNGQYTATATYQGRELTRRFSVQGNKGQRVGFAW